MCFKLQVNADSLEKILAFLQREDLDLEKEIDDDLAVRESFDDLTRDLHSFANANPEFDERAFSGGDGGS